jgi:taurine transport system permease protein
VRTKEIPPLARALRAGLAGLIIVGIWALAARILDVPFLPGPRPAVARFFQRLEEGSLSANLWASARRIGLALLFAGPSAAALGLAAGRSRRFDALLSPFVYLLHPLPKVAFLPIIMLFFGLGDAPKVILIGLIIFGQILVAARDASRAVDENAVKAVEALGARRLDLFWHVLLPASLPSLLTALRVSLGTAIAVLFLAETFATQSGLGYYIMDAWARVDYPDMYAAILALALFGLLVYRAIDLLEARLCRWRRRD